MKIIIFTILLQIYFVNSYNISDTFENDFENSLKKNINSSKNEASYFNKTISVNSDTIDTTESKQVEVKSRSKRFIYLNIDGTLDVGFLLIIPFTIILPPMSNLFNSWKFKRSIRSSQLNYDDNFEDESIVVQPSLDKIGLFFEMIKIPETKCQLRAVCEFSSNPDKYYPISDFVLNTINEPGLAKYFENHINVNKSRSLFALFSQAAEDGVLKGYEDCTSSYQFQCPYSIDQRLNMPVLSFWKTLNQIIDLRFHY